MPTITEDTTVLENLEFSFTPKCDNDSCDNDATHLIKCACAKGTEFSCQTCIMNMLADAATNPPLGGLIGFDPNKSCGHVTLINLCEIAPL